MFIDRIRLAKLNTCKSNYEIMKKNLLLLMMVVFLTISCTKKDEMDIVREPGYPKLMIFNNTNENNTDINSVDLVGYKFSPISINKNESKTFELNNGINGGYYNVRVIVSGKVGASLFYRDVKVNFKDGETTTIELNKTNGGYFLTVFY